MTDVSGFWVLFIVASLSRVYWYRWRVLSKEGMVLISSDVSATSAGPWTRSLAETQRARAFVRGRKGERKCGGQKGYADRNVRASWRLNPSLGMYSARPGTAGILESRGRRRRTPRERFLRKDNARLSDNWILSIKLGRKRKSRGRNLGDSRRTQTVN